MLQIEAFRKPLHINESNMPQTVGGFSRNVFGIDLISIETEHLQPGEV